ncbi:MAG: AraC family transcriptional regulator [Chthoniobacteraceae bacterium]
MSKSGHFTMIDDGDDLHLRWSRRFREQHVPVTAYHFPRCNHSGPQHDHEYIEIQLCAGGEGWQESPLGDKPFRKGDVLIIYPGAWHRHHHNLEMESYVCGFLDDLLQHELLWTLDHPGLNHLLWRASSAQKVVALHLDAPALSVCVEHFKVLAALGESTSPDSIPDRLGRLILILSCLAREIEPAPGSEKKESVHTAVKRSLALIHESLAEPWSAATLARRLNLDASYLGRLFQSALGVSTGQYIAQTRANRAASLLLRTARPIAEIAAEVGWPDANYFARCFRAHFDISASEYRTRHAKNSTQSYASQTPHH